MLGGFDFMASFVAALIALSLGKRTINKQFIGV